MKKKYTWLRRLLSLEKMRRCSFETDKSNPRYFYHAYEPLLIPLVQNFQDAETLEEKEAILNLITDIKGTVPLDLMLDLKLKKENKLSSKK